MCAVNCRGVSHLSPSRDNGKLLEIHPHFGGETISRKCLLHSSFELGTNWENSNSTAERRQDPRKHFLFGLGYCQPRTNWSGDSLWNPQSHRVCLAAAVPRSGSGCRTRDPRRDRHKRREVRPRQRGRTGPAPAPIPCGCRPRPRPRSGLAPSACSPRGGRAQESRGLSRDLPCAFHSSSAGAGSVSSPGCTRTSAVPSTRPVTPLLRRGLWGSPRAFATDAQQSEWLLLNHLQTYNGFKVMVQPERCHSRELRASVVQLQATTALHRGGKYVKDAVYTM